MHVVNALSSQSNWLNPLSVRFLALRCAALGVIRVWVFWLSVAGGFGGAWAAEAPVITAISPARQVIRMGNSLTLSVTATGAVEYQWMRNGRLIPGATAADYLIADAQLVRDAGWYQVEVRGLEGVSALSEPRFVLVEGPSKIWGWGLADEGQISVPTGLGEVVGVVGGGRHTVALRSDGTVAAWGLNTYGQTNVPVGLSGVVGIAAGRYHTVALRSDGTVVAFGDGFYGQTNVPVGLSGVVRITAGEYHTLALKWDGTVVAWGRDDLGQATVPVGLAGVVGIGAGGFHSVVCRLDGTVVAWGSNESGESGVPNLVGEVVMVAAGASHTLGLRSDGTVVGWGANSVGQRTIPVGLGSVVSLAAGADHSLALKSDGTVVSWGLDNFGQATVAEGVAGVVMISAGEYHSVALGKTPQTITFDPLADVAEAVGTVDLSATATSGLGVVFRVVTGPATVSGGVLTLTGVGSVTVGASQAGNVAYLAANEVLRTFAITASPPVITGTSGSRTVVAAGGQVTLSVTASRASAYQWKRNGRVIVGATSASYTIVGAQATRDSGWYQVDVVGAGDFPETVHSTPLFVLVEGPGWVRGWGLNDRGQRAPASVITGVVAIAGGQEHTVVLTAAGAVDGWGSNDFGQLLVPSGLVDAVAVAAGAYHTVALRSDGTVLAWGDDVYGQSTVPAGLTDVVSVVAGAYHTVALKSDGTVVAWGDDTYGQRTVPAEVTGLAAIASGSGAYHTMGLRPDGSVVAWGDNFYNQLQVPVGLSGVVGMAAGGYHSVVVKEDGTVEEWGDASGGVGLMPVGLSGIVAVSAGGTHLVGLRSDGTVVSWGVNTQGQTEVPASLSDVLGLSAGVYHTVSFGKRDQAIQLVVPAFALDDEVSVLMTGGATSGLPVRYRVVSGPGALLDSMGGIVSTAEGNPSIQITGVGLITVEASQMGNTDYSAALTVERSFKVVPMLGATLGTLTRKPGESTKYRYARLVDALGGLVGDEVTGVTVRAIGVEGGSVSMLDGWVQYVPPSGDPSVDQIAVMARSVTGGIDFGGWLWVDRLNPLDAGPSGLNVASIQAGVGGGVSIRVSGIPGRNYAVYRSTDLTQPWVRLGAASRIGPGLYEYLDLDTGVGETRFYRSREE